MLWPSTGSKLLVPTRDSAVARSGSTCRPHPAHRTAHGWLGRAGPELGRSSHLELSQRDSAWLEPEVDRRPMGSLRQLDRSVGLLSTQRLIRCCDAAAAVAVAAAISCCGRGVVVVGGGGGDGTPPVPPPKHGTRVQASKAFRGTLRGDFKGETSGGTRAATS
jgi:hypothetical protein